MKEQDKNKELISRYIDGEVTSEEKQTVEDILKQSPSLKAYYEELKKLDMILNTYPAEDISPNWEKTLQASLLKAQPKEEQKMKKKITFSALRTAAVLLLIITIAGAILIPTLNKMKKSGPIQVAQREIKETPFTGLDRQKIVAVGKAVEDKEDLSQELGKKHALLGDQTDVPVDELLYRRINGTKEKEESKKDITVASGKKPKGVKMEKALRPESRLLAEKTCVQSALVGGFMGCDEEVRMVHNFSDADGSFNTEEYSRIYENEFMDVKDNPLSTFSIDVDTASYSNVRRFLNSGQFPYADAVRIEEMINYFTYDYPQPEGEHPFSITMRGSVCPWNIKHQLVQIALQGKTLKSEELPPSNLVFLLDVSGSMNNANKLPLLKNAFKMLVHQLSSKERVAIVVYAGAAGLVLDSTPGNARQDILSAIDRLSAGGSTAGGAGIRLAYSIAQKNFIKGGNNRVILATDGDFNIGISSSSELTRLIEEKRKEGIFLTVLGFGSGNYKDSRMEQLADKGNGNYYYIDTKREAKKVLVHELGSTLFAIAKDVKIQIEFNPRKVKAYKLIGYENRLLAKEDFNDDTKDAGELGAGHTVTAFYEIVPAGSEEEFRKVDDLKYQQTKIAESHELMTVKLRYKEPDEDKSKLIVKAINEKDMIQEVGEDFRFAAAVAEFGLLLRSSQFKGTASYEHIITSASASKGKDTFGYRDEFIGLVKKAQTLDNRNLTTGNGAIQFKNN